MQDTCGITLIDVSIDCVCEQASNRDDRYQAQRLHEFVLNESLLAIAIPIEPKANVPKHLSATRRFRLARSNAAPFRRRGEAWHELNAYFRRDIYEVDLIHSTCPVQFCFR